MKFRDILGITGISLLLSCEEPFLYSTTNTVGLSERSQVSNNIAKIVENPFL
jgi:hypothetical protein